MCVCVWLIYISVSVSVTRNAGIERHLQVQAELNSKVAALKADLEAGEKAKIVLTEQLEAARLEHAPCSVVRERLRALEGEHARCFETLAIRDRTIEEVRAGMSQVLREKNAAVQEHAPCEATVAGLRQQLANKEAALQQVCLALV